MEAARTAAAINCRTLIVFPLKSPGALAPSQTAYSFVLIVASDFVNFIVLISDFVICVSLETPVYHFCPPCRERLLIALPDSEAVKPGPGVRDTAERAHALNPCGV